MTAAPFERGLDRPLTAADVDFLYALVLGRSPESGAVRADWLSQERQAGVLLTELVRSGEFGEVVRGLTAGQGLGGRFAAPLGATGARWACATFGALAQGASGWLQLLLRLRASGGLRLSGGAEGGAAAALEAMPDIGALGDAAVLAEVELFDAERLQGWALDLVDPDRALRLEVWIDGRFARALAPDRFRRDLQDRYGGAGRVGFDVTTPLAAADRGRPLRVELRTLEGRSLARATGAAAGPERVDGLAALRAELEGVRAALRRIEAALPDVRARTAFTLAAWNEYAQVFYGEPASLGVPGRASDAGDAKVEVRIGPGFGSARALKATLRSLLAQTHPHWTARLSPHVLAERGRAEGVRAAAADERITWAAAEGEPPPDDVDLVMFVTADDTLAPDALERFAAAHTEPARPQVLYADDDRRRASAHPGDPDVRDDPRLKSPFDPYLLLQSDYIGGVHAIDAGLLRATPAPLAAANSHARLLGATTLAGRGRVRHLARVLSHHGDTGPPPQPDAAAARAALADGGLEAEIEPHADVVGAPLQHALRVRGRGARGAAATVIIATRDRLDLLRPCVDRLLATRAANRTAFDLLVIDNGGVDPAGQAYLKAMSERDGVRVLRDPAPFNWAAINTRAALAAQGDVLVFLNDDTLAVSPDWCDELVFWAMQPRVGAVGARLLYGDGTIQHAGVVLGRFGSAIHEGVGAPGGEGGYLDRRKLVHATSAVTGACLATRAEVFRRLEGFDAARFGVAFNDMDYCLRLAEAGLDRLYTPHATFHHFESQSRGFGDVHDRQGHAQAHEELALFRRRHAAALARDPWVNPHFEPEAAAFSRLAPPPAQP